MSVVALQRAIAPLLRVRTDKRYFSAYCMVRFTNAFDEECTAQGEGTVAFT